VVERSNFFLKQEKGKKQKKRKKEQATKIKQRHPAFRGVPHRNQVRTAAPSPSPALEK
jgi:hypothetical protein